MALSLEIDPIHPPQPLALLAPSAMMILLVCKGYEPCVPTLYDLDHFRGLINTDIINALQYINGLLPAYFSHLPFTLQPKSFVHEIWIGTQSNEDPWPALQQYYAEANGPYMKLNLRRQEFESWDTLVVMVQGVVHVELFTQWLHLRMMGRPHNQLGMPTRWCSVMATSDGSEFYLYTQAPQPVWHPCTDSPAEASTISQGLPSG
ncbi:hypothetical protein K439DRAFT_1622735 [Ramaria rubella]|nr:hypothetical protein K439DRAFT_1622735 [Ramaria rubella]